MSTTDPTPNEETKKFLKLTWQQIIAATAASIMLGALGLVWGQVKTSIDLSQTNKENIAIITILMEKDIGAALTNFTDQLEETNGVSSALSANQRKIEIMMNRLEVVVENLEKRVDGL